MAKTFSEIKNGIHGTTLLCDNLTTAPEGLKPLAKQFGDLKRLHEALKACLDEVAEHWDECEKQLIEHMIDEGVSSIKIEGYGNFILSRSTYPNVNAANKPQFFEYLKASGNEGLLKLDVPTNTLTAFLKKHVDELKKQFTEEGVQPYQAQLLAGYRDAEGNAPYSDAAKSIGSPVDEMVADELATALLKTQGAAMFTKSGISLRK